MSNEILKLKAAKKVMIYPDLHHSMYHKLLIATFGYELIFFSNTIPIIPLLYCCLPHLLFVQKCVTSVKTDHICNEMCCTISNNIRIIS